VTGAGGSSISYRVLGCAGGENPRFNLPAFLVNDRILLDAGSATARLPLGEQLGLEAILVTHSHLDHVKDLAFLADNVFGLRPSPLEVCSIAPVLKAVREHLFNDVLWPDFTRIPSAEAPTVRLRELPEGQPARVGEYAVTPIRVNHVVECAAFFLEWRGRTILHVGDTGPTEAVWERARAVPELRAVIVEAAFPIRLQRLADASGHLTPASLEGELRKLGRPVPTFVYHLKPQFAMEVEEELRGLRDPSPIVLQAGKTYWF
jgi:ribonuclease BN (tRNA processing enzyme)